MTPIVAVHGIDKSFGPVVALTGVDLDLHVGEVLGLIGQNGSGKSTLLKLLAGLHQPDRGDIMVRGESVRLRSPAVASRLGIGLVHQEQSLVPNLRVAENIFLDKANAARRGGWYSWSRMYEAAQAQLEKIEVDIDPRVMVETLSFAQRQMVELAKVLAIEETTDQKVVVLLDEPTAVLAPSEIRMLFRQIRRLRARASVVFVSHRLDEVLEICDRVVVMTNSRKVAERNAADTHPEELYRLLVGHARIRAGSTSGPVAVGRDPHVRLRVKSLASPGHFANVSFDVREGEVLGLAGVVGSGAEEVCRALFGIDAAATGTIELNGSIIVPRSPRHAIALGLGYVPADRKAEGVLKGRTVLENMVLTFGPEYGRWPIVVDRHSETQEALVWMSRLKIRAQSPYQRVEQLSGGNQQKAVLGRWLLSGKLQVLLLDHPTRGLDPGARDDLYGAIRQAAANGLPIVLVADTVEEILEVADTIIVMRDGAITARFDQLATRTVSEADIVAAMI